MQNDFQCTTLISRLILECFCTLVVKHRPCSKIVKHSNGMNEIWSVTMRNVDYLTFVFIIQRNDVEYLIIQLSTQSGINGTFSARSGLIPFFYEVRNRAILPAMLEKLFDINCIHSRKNIESCPTENRVKITRRRV